MGYRPEITVELYGTLAALAGGQKRVTVEAGDLRDLYKALKTAYPAMAEHLESNVSVSIDGRVYTEALFEKIGPENEVVLLPRISGG
ncbi:MAG: MoaD/ThiS family protein [Pseudomonadota bacterium]